MAKPTLLKHLASLYVQRRLRRTFLDVRLLHGERLSLALEQGPVLIACNHVCWWDAFLLVQLSRALRIDGYCLMDQANLAELPFFSWVDAIPLRRTSHRAAHADLKTAALLLNQPRRALVIFPHGAQRPAHLPLEFKSGVATLARLSNAKVLPLSLRYDFADGPRPIVHLCVGNPMSHENASPRRLVEAIEQQVSSGLAAVDGLLLERISAPSILLPRTLVLTHERIPWAARWLRWCLRERGAS